VGRYVARRLAVSIAIIYIVISLSFFIVRLMPGNPVSAEESQLATQGMTTQQIDQQVNSIYAVMPRAPLWKQYFHYVGNAFQGNLGRSVLNPGETVVHIIANALPWTIFVVGIALIISFVIGVGLGAVLAALQHTRIVKAVTFVVSVLSAIPNYLVAIILLYLLADLHPIFPTGAAYSVNVTVGLSFAFIGSVIVHGVLPIAAYVITSFASWALAMKGTAVSVLGSEYVRAAEARGLSGRRLTQTYVGRNSMLPQVTQLALSIGFMFGGSIFIESYFSYPGIGDQLYNAVNSRDYSVMTGCFMLITIAVVVANFLVDLLYPLVDPRIARPGGAKDVGDLRAGAAESLPVGGSVA
jgi:peptide/nickel transport system permease protein